MKVIHGSLKELLQEAKERKVEAVRVAALMQSDVVAPGVPRYTAWVIVTAPVDWDQWTEWRLLIGRGRAEVGEEGTVIPPKITMLMKTRVAEVRTRVAATGLGFRDGVIAADAEAMDGVLD
jgi:hypothetical protein